jgi:D-3-phosphoglycerate dehydrogenase
MRGIEVINVPDYCREEVSDHALALILAMVRRLPRANADIQRGDWDQLRYRPIHRVNTLTLGLIGFGKIAQALARKAAALGMRIVANDPYAPPTLATTVTRLERDLLLGEADVVSLHVPLSNQTKGLIGDEALSRMKPGAILINTSRGELIDENALIGALDRGGISGAALDVTAIEPLPASSRLRGRSDVLLTPHMAFYSEESLQELQHTAADDVALFLTGQAPRNRAT